MDLVWAPYQHNNWVANLFTRLTEMALGAIPVIGPLLAVGFSIAVTAITDPDFFKSDNILGLAVDVLEAILDSRSQARSYMVTGFSFAPVGKSASRAALDDREHEERIIADREHEEWIAAIRDRFEREGAQPSAAFAARLEGLDDCAGHGPDFRRQPAATNNNDDDVDGALADREHGNSADGQMALKSALIEAQEPTC